MKRFGILIFAAFLGSAITIIAFQVFNFNNRDVIKIEHMSSTPVVGAAYSVDKEGKIVPLHFSDVAKSAMSAVVHIKSTQVQKFDKNRRYNNPYRGFFDDDVFEEFFGRSYRNRQAPNSSSPRARISSGSGVIINSEGYIVTNNHVVNDADDIEVILNDNKIFKAELIGVDVSTDIALLKIKANDLPFIPMADSDKIEVGEWVLAVGNPFNLNSTVTAGIVSAKGRNINILNEKNAIESFIQTDAVINPGNSGGALVNLQGALVGINTAIASPTGTYAGYGFAVPSNIVDKVVNDLINYGRVQRGYLGIQIRDLDGNLAEEKNLEITEGVYVANVDNSSSAGEAGIKPGDVICKFNGFEIKGTGNLLEMVARKNPGDKVVLSVFRNGKYIDIHVLLKNMNGDTELSTGKTSSIEQILGVEIERVRESLCKELGIDGGVKVSKINNGKIQQYTNLREGFIITSINGYVIKSVSDFNKALKDKKGGVLLEGVYEDLSGIYYYAFGL